MLVRSDLPAGLQIAQTVHGAFEFSHTHPDVMRQWLEDSNYLVVLGVADEGALLEHAAALDRLRIDRTLVTEPDLGDEATALVIAPGAYHRRLANLSLALREPAMA